MTPDAATLALVNAHPLRNIAKIPDEVLAECAQTAHQLYRKRQYADAEILCHGLIAADHSDAYATALLAAILQNTGRFDAAVVECDRGLKCHPHDIHLNATRDNALKAKAVAARVRGLIAKAQTVRGEQAAGAAANLQGRNAATGVQ